MTGPLSGYTIGVTADRRSDEQIMLFEGRGARCMSGPTIRTHPLRPEGDIAAATQQLLADPPEILVATTGIGIRGWFAAADALQVGTELRAALANCRIFARGPKAHGAAVTAGLDVEWSGTAATMAEVLDHVRPAVVPGLRVAIQVDGAEAQTFVDQLEDLGAEVLLIKVYRWSMPDDTSLAEALIRSVADQKVDAVTFTARPAAQNFVDLTRQLGLTDQVCEALSGPVKTFCVGPVCAEGISGFGVVTPQWPDRFRLGAMVMCVTESFTAQNRAVDIGGHVVQLQGRMAAVGSEPPRMLTGRERQVLDVLLARPGVVHTKEALLRLVWGANHEADAHVVEVTIGRLRRRLGPAGVGIETVMRRGYRASPT